jgi:predicted GIY-YIG superfamily endonuclease
MPALLGVLVQWVAILATMAVTDTKPFYATYLLTPRKPSTHHRTSTYVGFTVSPARRIRQHNRELEGGAAATDVNKPWEMLCVLHGFSSASSALSFEWAWQHAYSSAKTRECMAELIGEPGRGTACSVRRKLSEMCAMMFLPPWKGEHLTLSFTSIEALAMAHDLRVPPHTRVDVRAVETFPAEGNCCGVPRASCARKESARGYCIAARTAACCRSTSPVRLLTWSCRRTRPAPHVFARPAADARSVRPSSSGRSGLIRATSASVILPPVRASWFSVPKVPVPPTTNRLRKPPCGRLGLVHSPLPAQPASKCCPAADFRCSPVRSTLCSHLRPANQLVLSSVESGSPTAQKNPWRPLQVTPAEVQEL